MAKNIVVTNQKGGVAKTTTAITIAHALAERGRRTLLVDFDPQGQAALALGIPQGAGVFNLLINTFSAPQAWVQETGRDNLQIIPGNIETGTAQIVLNAQNRPLDAIEQAIKPLARQYDYIVFDTAPSVGGIQERAVWAANLVIIPVSTDYLAVDGLGKTLAMLAKLTQASWKGKLLGILPTFYDTVTRESKAALNYLHQHYPELVLTPIHRATILRECVSSTKTIWEKDPVSLPALDYQPLVKTILKAV